MTELTPEVLAGINLLAAQEEIANDEEYEAAMAYAAATEARIFELTVTLQKRLDEHNAQVDAARERYDEIANRLKSALYRQHAICEQYLMDKGTEPPEPAKKYTWSAEVFNLSDLVSAAAINPEYMEFLLPNQTKLNARARKEKSTMRVPGVVAIRREKS